MGTGERTSSEALGPLVVICVLYIVLDVFFVTLRFISRFLLRRSEIGWDDYLIIPAFVTNTAACACGLLFAYYESIGNQPASAAISEPDQIEGQVIPALKLIFASILLLTLGFSLSKLSILTLYLRIFAGLKTRVATFMLMGFVVAQALAFLLVTVLFCTPIEAFWDKRVVEATCKDWNFFLRSFSLPNILIDIAMLVTPIPAIWGLKASAAKRVGVTLIFLTGIIAFIASCVRWSVYAKVDATLLVPDKDAPLMYVNIIECSTYLIAACLPASWPAFNAIIPQPFRHRLEKSFPKGQQKYFDEAQLPYLYPRLHIPSPAPSDLEQRKSAMKLVGPPSRSRSPVPPRPDSKTSRLSARVSRDQLASKDSMQLVRTIELEDEQSSINTHGRSQSRAETIRRGEDEESALAELRRLASEHKIPTLQDGEHGLVVVHTEIEVTEEEGAQGVRD